MASELRALRSFTKLGGKLVCQHAKRNFQGQPAPLHPLAVAAVFQRWHMDVLGPLKKAEGGRTVYTLGRRQFFTVV